MKFHSISLGVILLLANAPVPAQLREAFQFHGFFSQGFAVSNHNNYLTMRTSRGSFKMADGGLNLTWRVNHKLRMGVQVYDRYIGDLGKGQVRIDWALVDYRFRDWLGFRLGKVKTPIGLFTDSQDQEFLYPWALLPQAVYPLDLRETNNAHTGGDLYGTVGLRRRGSLEYQMYAGKTPTDYRTGYVYGIEDSGFKNVTYSGRAAGYDVRWTAPDSALMAGFSQSFHQREFAGELVFAPVKGSAKTYFSRESAFYAELTRGRWRFDAEYRASKTLARISLPMGSDTIGGATPGWFAALSYRLSPLVEIGAYRSQFKYKPLLGAANVVAAAASHMHDSTFTLRLDPTRFWNLKVEGHFIDGFGNSLSSRGFYPRYHPLGINPSTRLLVIRTGFTF
jgi:hypothetical protein